MHRFFTVSPGPAPAPDPPAAASDRPWREAYSAGIAAELDLPWPEQGTKAKAGRPTLDNGWQKALYEWVRRHVEMVANGGDGFSDPRPSQTRPPWWRQGMALFLEDLEETQKDEKAQTEDGVVAPKEEMPDPTEEGMEEAGVHPYESPKKYHRSKDEVRHWVRDYAFLRLKQKWSYADICAFLQSKFPEAIGSWLTPRLLGD